LADDKGSFGRRPSSSSIWSMRRVTLQSSFIDLYISHALFASHYYHAEHKHYQEAVTATKLREKAKTKHQKNV